MATAVAGVQERHERRVDALTALRILTGIAGLWVLWLLRPWDFAGIGLERRGIWGSEIVEVFPQSWLALRVGAWLFAAVLGALIAGWRTQVMAWTALVLGVWLYGMSQGISGTTHVHHLLIMFAVLGASAHPGWAMVFARVGVGCVYFFPGVAKLLIVADWPDYFRAHLSNHQTLYNTTVEVVPPAAITSAMAVGAVLFEVFFGALLFTRWRRHAVVAAICFHVTTGLLMGIWFQGLIVILPAFLLSMPTPRGDIPRALIPAGALIFGMAVAGFAGQNQAWPVASYPKFDHRPGGVEVTVAIATTENGERQRVGQVLLPHHAAGYWSKIEHTHPAADLDRAVERRLDEPVTITWENP